MNPPSPFTALRLLLGLSLRHSAGARMLWLMVVLAVLPVAAAVLAVVMSNADLTFFKLTLGSYLRFFSPFLMALCASSAVAEEVQGKTITYLFSRPIPRWTVPLGKYLGSIALSSLLLCASLVLVYLVCMIRTPGLILDELAVLGVGLAGVLLATVHFGAVATAFSTLVTSFPFAAALGYFLMVELGFSNVPGRLKLVSMTVHLLNITGLYRAGKGLFVNDPSIDPLSSLVIILGFTVGWITLAILWVQKAEYRTDR